MITFSSLEGLLWSFGSAGIHLLMLLVPYFTTVILFLLHGESALLEKAYMA